MDLMLYRYKSSMWMRDLLMLDIERFISIFKYVFKHKIWECVCYRMTYFSWFLNIFHGKKVARI